MKNSEINIRDPFVLLDGDTYYLYGTRGNECWTKGTGLDVYVGSDLENWSEPKVVFEKTDDFWADRNFWAPEVHKYNGEYYMFVSFKSAARQRGTQILKAESPLGPFFRTVTDRLHLINGAAWMGLFLWKTENRTWCFVTNGHRLATVRCAP